MRNGTNRNGSIFRKDRMSNRNACTITFRISSGRLLVIEMKMNSIMRTAKNAINNADDRLANRATQCFNELRNECSGSVRIALFML
jgi:hypothetical protein